MSRSIAGFANAIHTPQPTFWEGLVRLFRNVLIIRGK